ncbi:HMG-Y-related protein A-like [Quercus lobata]|uniref:HMG-Y-related protein A n=1 Tax=Quercus lobata TaxID=97700 RepID=A0A7N2KXL8_QUELO|nr:HMG-Y-related protein A-like [Quercus lobata]
MAAEEVNKPKSLPPYPEMIMDAIEALDEKNGSNKSAISRHIESTYGDLPAGHSALLTDHLNNMKDSGELVFYKNNYIKPDPNAPPRRGRGRPPKPKGLISQIFDSGPARPRGRPPKDPNAAVLPKSPKAPPKLPKVKASSGSGKPRGRPRKMARPSGGLGGTTATTEPTATTTGKPRGRPPKVKDSMTEVSVEQ